MSDQDQIPVPTIEGFKKWLSEQPEYSIVGYAGDSTNCPFFNYLKTLSDCFTVAVGSYYRYKKENTYLQIEAESWVVKFIDRVDNLQHFINSPVSAEQALEILNEVTA